MARNTKKGFPDKTSLTVPANPGKIPPTMPSNIEKLAEEINALFEDDPIALNSGEIYISQTPGEDRLYIKSLYEEITAYILFTNVLPYDPAGGAGTTDDVLADAIICVHADVEALGKREANKLRQDSHYCIFWDLYDAAKAGKISSKSFGMRIPASVLRARKIRQKQALADHKKRQKEFLDSLDPITRRGFKVAARDIQAKRKKESKK